MTRRATTGRQLARNWAWPVVLAARIRLWWWRNVAGQIYRPGMAWFGDVAVSELLGGISDVLGGGAPAGPPPAPSPTPPAPRPPPAPLPDPQLLPDLIGPAIAGPTLAPAPGGARPPGSPPPAPPGTSPAGAPTGADDLSGAGADAAKQVDDALAHNHSALNDGIVKLLVWCGAARIGRCGECDEVQGLSLSDRGHRARGVAVSLFCVEPARR